jgi:uncharacterized lipoprotein YbaY
MSRMAFRLDRIAFSFAAGLVLPASSLIAQEFASDRVSAARNSEFAQQSPAPPPHPASRSPMKFALPQRTYVCANGVKVAILVETKALRLTMNDHIYSMKQVQAPSGTKYAEGSVIWSSNGEDGSLEDDSAPGPPKMLATNCHLESTFPPTNSSTRDVTGTAAFGKRPTLPSDAVLIVQLRDLSRDPDDPAAVLAEERVPIGGGKSPVSFAVKFDPAAQRLDAAKTNEKIPIALAASITGNGKLLFVLVRPVTIPDIANPAAVSLALSRATPSKGQNATPVPEAPPHF